MLSTIAIFELRKRLTLLSTYVYLALFFACGVITMFAAGGAFSNVTAGAGSERINANAPLVLQGMIATISYLGILMSAAVFGQAVHQDFESRTDSLLFTYPITKSSYLGGRFLGAFIFVAIVFLFIGLGVLAGAHFPFLIDKTLFGPTPLRAYFWPYIVTVFPNLFFTGALFFALGALTRKMMPVYLGAVIVVLGYLISRLLLSDVENLTVAAWLDPFGGAANAVATRYWTVAEKNLHLIPLRGLLLGNRLLWCSLGVIALLVTGSRFRMGHAGAAERKQKVRLNHEAFDASGQIPTVPVYRSNFASFLTLTRLGFAETIKNTYFAVLVFAAMVIALASMSLAGKFLGAKTWPVTNSIASIGEGAFSIFMLIIITFYSGEIIWRERDLNLDQITDALPIPTWVTYLSKLLSLCLVPLLLLAAIIVAGVAFQTSQGYFHYELGLYFKRLYLDGLPSLLFICVLAFFVQSMVQNKYVGHFLMVAYYVSTPFMDKIGLTHGLFKYGDTPSAPYSDMNGFGHFAKPVAIYDLYWSGFALILTVVGLLFWNRGTEPSFKARAAIARARFTGLPRAGVALGLLLALGAGGTIYYNEDVLNKYMTSHQREQLQVEHEKKYKQFESAPEPRITAVHVDYDLYPAIETLNVSGSYQLENKSGKPISTVYVEIPGLQKFETLTLNGVSPAESDPMIGFDTFRLATPLAPGERAELDFVARYHDAGFKDDGNRTDLAANGTFFNNGNLPHIGYDRNDELIQDNDRKKYGLAPRARMPDLHDVKGLANNLIAHDADWVQFDGTVTTSEDQLAVLPGTLVKEWTENGRRHFHYTMDTPILDFFALNSARYSVRKEEWNGIALEIDYHRGHEFDLDEMFRGMKDGLSYYTKNFGPFQFHQLRIVEFPKYASFAQSFPSVIPYSESVGFIFKTDPAKKDDVDLPYYVTAHEVAHQWWAHQVIGGDVQGVTLLDETLAQYSALMVMKARFGEAQMRRFLKYELDQYLRGRALEQQKELPLLRVENQQYIHYNKGSLVMYALQDYIGEAKVNQALKAFLDQYKFKGPPYPNAQALFDEFVKVTPSGLQYVLHDLFETITLYDNRAVSAVATKRPDGKYELTLKVSIKKLQAGEQGAEKEVPANDYIDIGAVDADGNPIALERRQLKSGESVVTLTVDKLPARAGVDPVNKLIDRDPKDNMVAVVTQ